MRYLFALAAFTGSYGWAHYLFNDYQPGVAWGMLAAALMCAGFYNLTK